MKRAYPLPATFAAVLVACSGLAAQQSAPGVSLVWPGGGEVWAEGSLHRVSWFAAPEVAEVDLVVSVDGRRTWQETFAHALPAAPDLLHSYVLKVPPAPNGECTIAVAAREDAKMRAEATVYVTGSQEARYRWTCVTEKAAFAGRDGAGALSFNGRMWLLGGWNPGDKVNFPTVCNSEVWSSHDGLEWREEVAQAPWEGRHTAGYVVHDGRTWIVGGDCIGRHYQNDVWSSADGVNWDLVCERVPWAERVLHHTVAFAGKIWVMGGQTLPQFAPAQQVYYDDVWCSEDGANWTRVTEHAGWPQRGMIGGSVVLHDRMWLLGGGTYDTPTRPERLFYNDVWSSADGVHWDCVSQAAPWHPRQYHDVAAFDDRMWVLEGWNQGNRNDVWYSADGVNWYEVADTPWAVRHAASVFVHDGALWMVAGNNMFPDVWKLTRE